MRWILVIGVMITGIVLSACAEKDRPVGEQKQARKAVEEEVLTVQEILNNRKKYTGRDVTLRGQAIAGLAFEFVDEQPYRLKDHTGEIWVITRGLMPADGTTVTVTGKVVAPYQIKGRRFEIAVIERERR